MFESTKTYKTAYFQGVLAGSEGGRTDELPYDLAAYNYTKEGIKRDAWLSGFLTTTKNI